MSLRIALAAAGSLTLLASGAAGAQGYYDRGLDYGYEPGVQYAPPGARGYAVQRGPYGYYGPSAQQSDNYEYNFSGTRGREGLGADPRHPEGPGNQALPGLR